MSQNKTLKIGLFLVGWLLWLPASQAQRQTELPLGLQQLIFAEQQLLSRDVNEDRVMSPKENHQEAQYKPENGQVFEVKSYWVAQKDVRVFESAYISKAIKDIFLKNNQTEKKVLMLVHPESESLFADFLQNAEVGPRFWATSTASSRTLLMWPDGHPEQSFFGKLSLNKNIGGVVRTIPQSEVARSVGTNEVLFLNQKYLPESFRFMPESLSLIPKGFDRGGMIIREIPQDIASGQSRFLPLFSLYAAKGSQKPLLVDMINASGENPRNFIEDRIIAPFIKQWLEMVLVHGISMEPHAQNVLIGLNAQGLPNGQFLHRDFGGFNMDLENFSKLGTVKPKNWPITTDLAEDYHQAHVASSIRHSLTSYFYHGFVYNLDEKVSKWIAKGWIKKDIDIQSKKYSFSSAMIQSLSAEFTKLTGGQVNPEAEDLSEYKLPGQIRMARSYLQLQNGRAKKALLCEGIFQ